MISLAIEDTLGGFALKPAFDAPDRGVTALFGASGCGKTATLLAIAGLSRPRSGRIVLGDTVLFDAGKGIDVKPEERGIGFVFQDARLFPHLGVRENLDYGAKRRRGRTEIMNLAETARLLDLGDLLERQPTRLSGGEKQRVAIGRAILSAPRLLLMDEPLAALDEARKAEFLPFLERLHNSLAIPTIYVTHALDEVARIADWMVVMDRGGVIASGASTDILSRADVPLLANRSDVGAVLSAIVLANETERGMTRLAIGATEMLVPLMDASPGCRVRLRVLARDVAIALKPPEGLSMQNIVPCTVAALAPRGATNHLVRLDIGGSHLLSLITTDSVRRLNLDVGKPAYALVKSVASGVFA